MIWWLACTKVVCDTGYALASDGVCYPIADTAEPAGGDDTDVDEGGVVDVAAPGDGSGDGGDGGDGGGGGDGGDGGDGGGDDTAPPPKGDGLYDGTWKDGDVVLTIDADFGDLETDVCTGSLTWMDVWEEQDPQLEGELSCTMNDGSDIGAAFGSEQHASFTGSLKGDEVTGTADMFGGAVAVPFTGAFLSETSLEASIDYAANVGFDVQLTGTFTASR